MRAWRSEGRVFLFVTEDRRAQVEALLPPQRYVVAESSGKVVYSNQP